MAPKKINGYVKLQIMAGKATPAPPVGPALGQAQGQHHGVREAIQRPGRKIHRWLG